MFFQKSNDLLNASPLPPLTSYPNKLIIFNMSKKGLVLEGGALRGLFTMGILDTLVEKGILFDGACGVSAGVAFGCNYKSKQIGRVLRYNQRFNKEWRFKGFRSLLLTGDLFGADFCYNKLPNELDRFDTEMFANNPMDFWAVVSNCETGKAEYHKLTDGGDDDMMWIRASASMPLASKPVKINGTRYLDGGLADSIPLKFMEEQGFDRNVVILTQPREYIKKPYNKVLTVPLANMPEVSSLVKNRHEIYNAQTEYVKTRENEGKAFVLAPDMPLNIGSLERDPAEMRRVYEHGREVINRRLNELTDYLK